jgi:hypothetical protein
LNHIVLVSIIEINPNFSSPMSLKLYSANNASTPDAEFILARAEGVTNLSGYAIIDRTFTQEDTVSNEFRHIYIFPRTQLADGDWVCIYSGTGTNRREKLKDSDKYMYFFHWGAGTCIWNNNGGDTASLLEIKLVNSIAVPAVK